MIAAMTNRLLVLVLVLVLVPIIGYGRQLPQNKGAQISTLQMPTCSNIE
ncbi:hypothetical protein [Undibacterium sp. SXout20W]